MLDKYKVIRPLSKGRCFNFIGTHKVSFIYNTIDYDFNDVSWIDYKAPAHLPVLSVSDHPGIDPFTVADLLSNGGRTARNIADMKHPDMWRYAVSVPVYYGLDVRVVRAYLSLNNTGSVPGSDEQFMQNLEGGMDLDFGYWFDSTNIAYYYQFHYGKYGLSWPFLADKRFTWRHHSVDHPFSVKVGCQLPSVDSFVHTSLDFTKATRPYLSRIDNDTIVGSLSHFYSQLGISSAGIVNSTLTDNVPNVILGCPGDFYLCPVFPYYSVDFVNLLTSNQVSLIVDAEITYKLGIRSSYRMPTLEPWFIGDGYTDYPVNLL